MEDDRRANPLEPALSTNALPWAGALALGAAVLGAQAYFAWQGLLAVSSTEGTDGVFSYVIAVLCIGLVGATLRYYEGTPVGPALTVGAAALLGCAFPTLCNVALHELWKTDVGAFHTWVQEVGVQIEAEQGYSLMDTRQYPQASRRTAGRLYWSQVEVDRSVETPALAPGARGVIISYDEDTDEVSLDPIQPLLRMSDLAASTPDEIAWVALVQRVWPIEATYGEDSALFERADLRLVDLASGEVIARASIGRVAPATMQARPSDAYSVRARWILAALDEALERARSETAAAAPPWDAGGCVIAPAFRESSEDLPVECLDGATTECDALCYDGSIRACEVAGYTLDHGPPLAAQRYYALGCRAGSANACTNWAAALVRYHADDETAQVCALAIYEQTCAAAESFGCGMLAEMLMRGLGGPSDAARARELLESSCDDEDNAFSCDALGTALSGDLLGTPDPVAAAARWDRACALGRAAACAR